MTIPLGASQAKNILSLISNSWPIVAKETEIGLTTTIIINTQITPPQPRGLNSPQETSEAKRGKRTVIANWANSLIRLSNLSLSITSRLPTINPAATEAGKPDSGRKYSQIPYTKKIIPTVTWSSIPNEEPLLIFFRISDKSQPATSPINTPPPNLSIKAIKTSWIPCKSPNKSSKINKANTAPIGSKTKPSAFNTLDKGEASFICSTNGDITVGPVAKTIEL